MGYLAKEVLRIFEENPKADCLIVNESLIDTGDSYETHLTGPADVLFRDGTLWEGCEFEGFSDGWEVNVQLRLPAGVRGEKTITLLYQDGPALRTYEMGWTEWDQDRYPGMRPHYWYLN